MRSLSNLIKSGKVIDVSVPVNVGLSYNFNSFDKKTIEKKKIEPEVQAQNDTMEEVVKPKEISQDEIMEKYIAEAKKKAEEVYQNEIKKAYDEGIERAKVEAENIIKRAEADYQSIIDEIAKIKEEAILDYKNEVGSLEGELLDLSLTIAEKIINYEVNRTDDYILGIVKDALNRVMSKKDVILKLSTADYYTVLSNKKLLVSTVKGFGEIELVQDESMDPGTCIVDTPMGVIDGSLQIRMDNIQKEIEKMLAK